MAAQYPVRMHAGLRPVPLIAALLLVASCGQFGSSGGAPGTETQAASALDTYMHQALRSLHSPARARNTNQGPTHSSEGLCNIARHSPPPGPDVYVSAGYRILDVPPTRFRSYQDRFVTWARHRGWRLSRDERGGEYSIVDLSPATGITVTFESGPDPRHDGTAQLYLRGTTTCVRRSSTTPD